MPLHVRIIDPLQLGFYTHLSSKTAFASGYHDLQEGQLTMAFSQSSFSLIFLQHLTQPAIPSLSSLTSKIPSGFPTFLAILSGILAKPLGKGDKVMANV